MQYQTVPTHPQSEQCNVQFFPSHVDNLAATFESDTRWLLIKFWIVTIIFGAISALFCTLAFVVPAPGFPVTEFEGGWFWGFFGTAIGLFSICFLLIILGIAMSFTSTATIENFKIWETTTTLISWSKSSYTQYEWQQFLEEEYGQKGRSAIRYDRSKFIALSIGWIFLFGVASGITALRMWLHDATGPVGDLPFGGFVTVIGASAATLLVITFIVLPEVAFSLKKSRASAGPMDFKATVDGFYWDGHLVTWQLSSPSCCLMPVTIEDMRVNNYEGSRQTCLEICTSTMQKSKKIYIFHRIPVPKSFINDAIEYTMSSYAGHLTTRNTSCWQHQKDYALDLEEGTALV